MKDRRTAYGARKRRDEGWATAHGVRRTAYGWEKKRAVYGARLKVCEKKEDAACGGRIAQRKTYTPLPPVRLTSYAVGRSFSYEL